MKKVDDSIRFRDSALLTMLFLVLLWGIRIVEGVFEVDFGSFGIFPRTLEGSIGIVTGPLVHGDYFHLISNTFPIAILGIGVIYFYREIAHYVIGIIYLLSGFWVWLIARDAYHIGASGLVYGLMFFLLISGLVKKDRRQLAISFVMLVIYGGTMFTGLMPTDGRISYEAHIMGALSGVFCAIIFRKSKVHLFEDGINDFLPSFSKKPPISHTGQEEFSYKIEYRDKEESDG